MIKKLKFMSICIADQKRALKFYTEKLGFEVFTDQPFNDKQRWIELKIPGSETGIVLFTPEGHENRVGEFVNGSFTCDDLQATYDTLMARGVDCTEGIKAEPWGSYLIIKDSEGNQLCLSGR